MATCEGICEGELFQTMQFLAILLKGSEWEKGLSLQQGPDRGCGDLNISS